MADIPLFVTAKEATKEDIDRFLLATRTDQYDNVEEPLYYLVLVTSTELPSEMPPTIPPISSFDTNDFAGKPFSDIDAFSNANKGGPKSRRLFDGLFVVLDSTGLANGTCIVGEETFSDETDEATGVYQYGRMPWSETWNVTANLSISNVSFEELFGYDGPGADGVHSYVEDG